VFLVKGSLPFRERQHAPTDIAQVKEFNLFVVSFFLKKRNVKGAKSLYNVFFRAELFRTFPSV